MQASLSFDQAPPLAAPLRFFVSAPVFAMLAGILILWSGPDLFASRWSSPALALTHLITVGFMLQAMLGAMLQILPVVAGVTIARPLLVATVVHLATFAGALLLVIAFLSYQALAFRLAALSIGTGVAIFVGAAGHALYALRSSNPTIQGLKLSLIGLCATVCLGLLLITAINEPLALSLPQVTAIHVGWGVIGWGMVLLAAVALVVVPMFQLTPAYPAWFARWFGRAAVFLLGAWSASEALDWYGPSTGLASLLVLTVALFAAQTWQLQRQSKRARFDAGQRFWRVGMACLLTACVMCLAALAMPGIADRREWPLFCGILIFVGGFMSVIIGMLYKIVPFLVWLHLQNIGGARALHLNMNKVIAGRQIERQMLAHFFSVALLLAAALWPDWFSYPAGAALLLANAWLLRNLVSAVAFYRQHCAILATPAVKVAPHG